ncbi:MAG: aldo/keto reductase [Opitutaceae bacterium]
MHYRKLGETGLTVSVLGFGASSLGGVFGHTDDRDAVRTVHVALDLGINFIDVSPYYGATRAETTASRTAASISRCWARISTAACGRSSRFRRASCHSIDERRE